MKTIADLDKKTEKEQQAKITCLMKMINTGKMQLKKGLLLDFILYR